MYFTPIFRTSPGDRRLLTYALSWVAVSLALAATMAVPPLHVTPTVLFFAAIAIVAWYGGSGPALLAAFLSCLSLDYFLISPTFSVLSSVADLVRFAAFTSVAALVCFLQQRNQRITEELRQLNNELELKVMARTAELCGANTELQSEVDMRREAEAALRVSERELRRTLDHIAASLKEKEVLLRELNHRVKNNLQIISSLFSLQAKMVQDPPSRLLFKDCQDRVRTIALVHEKLYTAANLARIDLDDYYRDLLKNLFRSFGRNPGTIVPNIRVDNMVLEIDHIIPCALIVNELVSNALKYAFPDGRAGNIDVDLHRLNDNVTLSVADDGVGSSGVPEREEAGDGLQIVRALVDQLAGDLQITNGRGMTYRVTFPGTHRR